MVDDLTDNALKLWRRQAKDDVKSRHDDEPHQRIITLIDALIAARLDGDTTAHKLAEIHQVLAVLAVAFDVFDHPEVIRAMDNAANSGKYHADLLPWPKIPLRRNDDTGSSNGRTTHLDCVNPGSTPGPVTNAGSDEALADDLDEFQHMMPEGGVMDPLIETFQALAARASAALRRRPIELSEYLVQRVHVRALRKIEENRPMNICRSYIEAYREEVDAASREAAAMGKPIAESNQQVEAA